MPDRTAPRNRRDEYARMTRQDVIDAARKLFFEQGYEQTTVADIARQAQVSPATVYAQLGGKEGLLQTLMDVWSTSPTVARVVTDSIAQPTGPGILAVLADGYIEHAAEAGDIMTVLELASASSTPAREFMDVGEQRHREALQAVTQALSDIDALADGLSVADAALIIYFHFRHPQLVLASDTFGWGTERARQWLLERVMAAILKS
ncbi:TetR/AcrR family transcriptional regulator [Kineosporia succinea]|uniref:AcrR family transcriptional regulator n=1 Tax=Kineosporia succinea TaxID=84632 RepID=A0ABT9PE47_9ACTN|nr:TetR/AcrR family transcriptional regulator [Kineosporia succinea]MDP9830976.1 AcrR family transcriptional regulator [Kineosporia succinea]